MGILLFAAAIALLLQRGYSARARFDEHLQASLRAGQALLDQGDFAGARRATVDVAVHARTSVTRNAALTTLAWAALGEGHPTQAKEALDRIRPEHTIDLYCLAAMEAARGKPEIAIQALELARGSGCFGCEAAKLLIDLHAQQNRIERAIVVALENFRTLGIDNCRKVMEAGCNAGAFREAATLGSAIFGATCAPADGVALIRALARADEPVQVRRALDDIVTRLRERGSIVQARRLVSDLRTDESLPRGLRSAFDGTLLAIEME